MSLPPLPSLPICFSLAFDLSLSLLQEVILRCLELKSCIFFSISFYYAYISNAFKTTKITTYGNILKILILCVPLARISLSVYTSVNLLVI